MSKKIKLKKSALILKESDDVYKVVFPATRKIKKFGVDSLVREVIEQAKSENEKSVIIKNLTSNYNRDDVESCLKALEDAGIITTCEKDYSPRHQRQIAFIDELTGSREETLELQKRIEDSTIAVFGVGGIGTWIVNGLQQIGVGTIKITDPDTISCTNLNRQLYFTSEDVGKYKVDVIKDRIKDANIITYKKTVAPKEDLEEIVSGCNFLVNCADSPSVANTTRIISGYANTHRIAYSIAGGYNMHLGMVGPIIVPGKTACFDCLLEYQKENNPFKGLEIIKDTEQTGSLGPIAGVISNLQVIEIFKYLIGKGSVNFNKYAEIDFMNFNVTWHDYLRKQDCPECH